jgi:hypothetical protein
MLVSRSAPGDNERALGLLEQAWHSATTIGMTRLCRQIEALQEQMRRNIVCPLVATSPETLDAIFRQDGKQWLLCFAGQTVRQHDVKGLHYLAYLLQHPKQEVHVFDLLALTDTHAPSRRTAGLASLPTNELVLQSLSVSSLPSGRPLPDTQACTAYRERLRGLQEDLAEAERHNDVAWKMTIQAEMEALTEALSVVYGTGKYARSAADATEKARKAVTNRIRAVLAKLQPIHPSLWQHLFTSLKTGTFCVYRPEQPVLWS